jgi:Beta-lactamase superfamily domain
MRFVTVGVGAQDSPLYGPAGLLVCHGRQRVMIDGGPGAEPSGRIDAWLVCDERSELRTALRRLASARGLAPVVAAFKDGGLALTPRPVVHTSHPTYGYLIEAAGVTVVWAPEFLRFPRWAKGADLMFAEAAAWDRPIRFVGGVGGHMPVLEVAAAARRASVKRLVFAHVGRPTLRALAKGLWPPFGEVARDRQVFDVRRPRQTIEVPARFSGPPPGRRRGRCHPDGG